MDDVAPVIHGPAETLATAKKARKKPVNTSAKSKKRISNTVLPNSENGRPAKRSRTRKPKSSTSREGQDDPDISKALPKTKPGVPHNNETGKIFGSSDLSLLSPTNIKDSSSTLLNSSRQRESDQITKQRSRSTPSSLSQSYQNAFPAQKSVKDDRGKQHQIITSSITLNGSFESMMDRMVDDDFFFKRLDGRPKQSGNRGEDFLSSEGQTTPTPYQATEFTSASVLPKISEHDEGLRCRDSFFDEALESLALEEVNTSQPSSSLTDPADTAVEKDTTIEDSNYTRESSPWNSKENYLEALIPPLSASDAEPEDDTRDVDEASEVAVDDNDDYPLSDQDDCFEVDNYGEKKEINNKIVVHAEPATLAEDPFADEDLDAELLTMSAAAPSHHEGQSPPFTQRTPPKPKLHRMPPTPYSRDKPPQRSGPLVHIPNTAPIATRTPLSPISPNTSPRHISLTPDGKPLPFIRPQFPTPLLPRSPIPGLSPTTFLRTCFRIGEALNAASLALRGSSDAIIELYCRVKHSGREANGYKQYFEFADLFSPDKPPSLDGVYAIWTGVDLWDYDSRAFIEGKGQGKMARVIGRIKRGDGGKGWEMNVLNIWEAGWDDVAVVKGVICS
ncbi:hypothetical protein G7Y79_00015g038350 [Physcia stellaris]|nr:hypothetical protein G7Y79_00015g038350 [Physcia stellaris]